MRLSHKIKRLKKNAHWKPKKRIILMDEAHMFFSNRGKVLPFEPLSKNNHSVVQSLEGIANLCSGRKSDPRSNPLLAKILAKE